MRFEFVTDTFPPDVNGVAMTLGRLTQCLKERGHYVHVVRTGDDAKLGQTVHASWALPGYKDVRVGLPGSLKLRKRWKKKRPDAIYVATESPLGYSAIKVAKEMGIPVAAGFHTNFQQYVKQYKLGAIQKPAMAYLRRVHAKADCTVAPSMDVVRMLEADGFHNVKLMGRGVDSELFHPEKRCAILRNEWGARAATPVVLIAGRVAAEKNLVLAMNVVRKMRTQMPELKAVVVGDGPILEKLKHENSEVVFTGMLGGEDLAKHYASADILLFPSETETFGNVLLEGMASGLLTVSYRYAASGIYIQDGQNGLHAEHGDEDAYLEKCMSALRLYNDETLDGTKYLVIHGDGFDSVSTNHKWLAGVGAAGYDFLLKVNRFYNHYRAWRGKEYFSLSKAVKAKVKSAVSFVDNYEEKLQDLAKVKGCKGIICGHIHTPADKQVGDIYYLNSGDWVETLSCVVEYLDGGLEVVHYEDLMERLEIKSHKNTPANDDEVDEAGVVGVLREHSNLQQAVGRALLNCI